MTHAELFPLGTWVEDLSDDECPKYAIFQRSIPQMGGDYRIVFRAPGYDRSPDCPFAIEFRRDGGEWEAFRLADALPVVGEYMSLRAALRTMDDLANVDEDKEDEENIRRLTWQILKEYDYR